MADDDLWHLPKFMRDFHDQKDLFRAINAEDEKMRLPSEREKFPLPHWMDAHVYTVDVFLRFMAEHGYTLQRCRRDFDYKDLDKTVAQHRDARQAASAATLSSLMRSRQ